MREVRVSRNERIEWPDGKRFAFSIFDDTDFATLENVAPVYDFLADLGFRTTKSVWVLNGYKECFNTGATCENRDYLNWLYRLKEYGFEIAYHLATYHTSYRAETIKALDSFTELFGGNPISMANHADCMEGIYWGKSRVSGLNQIMYRLLNLYHHPGPYTGHIQGDSLFWGDYCKKRIKYTRNFVFPEINTLKACPFMPYHDPTRPFVNYWFASTEGAGVQSLNEMLSEQNQDRLEQEGGACIIYTHLACGFYENGRLNTRFETLMKRLSRKNGWFVPVSELLDYLVKLKGPHTLTNR
jgi:hypothetical protein